MQRRAVGQRGSGGLLENGVAEKFAALDGGFDARVVLINDAAGADVEMADFRIAHLRGGQAHPLLGSVYGRVRAGFPEEIPVRFARLADRVVGALLAIAEAVEYDQ